MSLDPAQVLVVEAASAVMAVSEVVVVVEVREELLVLPLHLNLPLLLLRGVSFWSISRRFVAGSNSLILSLNL